MTKILNFLIRLLAFVFLCGISYIVGIFIFPDFADQYGNISFNQYIRELKDQSLLLSQP